MSDEFYWAAAELYVTFGRPALLDYLRKSPYHGKFQTLVGRGNTQHHSSMTWQDTAALGAITLAVVPNELPAAEVGQIRAAIVAAGDEYLGLIEQQGYRLPMRAGTDEHYPWGSNSFVINNALVLALAHDFTREPKYLDGVVEAMDYLLGKNPLSFSYVAGYGESFLVAAHHRFWAHAQALSRPPTAPGSLAGGPNSRLQDPTMKRLKAGCRPLECYLDDINAWSVNEVAINWNAPLAWVAAYLDEQGQLAAGSSARPQRAPHPHRSAPAAAVPPTLPAPPSSPLDDTTPEGATPPPPDGPAAPVPPPLPGPPAPSTPSSPTPPSPVPVAP